MSRVYKYPIVIYEEKGRETPLWIGNFPGLNGCWVEGDSLEDVTARAPSVLLEYCRGCEETEWPVPEAPDMKDLQDSGVGYVTMIETAS